MPTYDYRCDACGHTFEKFQSITAASLRKCPSCQTNKLKRLIGTGAAVLFKGAGFYETDYRSDAYKKSAQADKPSEGKPEKAADASPDKSTQTPAKAPAATSDKTPAKKDVPTPAAKGTSSTPAG